jgi:serine/threonine protein kinase
MTLEKPGAPSKLGKYELLREQAGLGAGSTWIARATEDTGESPKLFSVVRVHKHLVKKQEVADALVSEILSAADLRHASVASVVEVGNADGEILVATAHHDGEVLSTLVTSAGATGLPLPVVLRIALDALGALAVAQEHEPPIMHGELGPQYVNVGVDGVTRLSGFATARSLSKLAAPVGPKQQDRISYAAPERIKAMASPTAAAPAPDPRADVFSVGVMLWEGISRQRLFASKIDAAIVQKVLTSPIAALSSLPGISVPAEIDAAVQKALERDPQKRASVADLRAAIEAVGADKIATPQQVAELVEKLAGKAIAARQGELRALLQKKTPSIAPPAAAALGTKAAVARKATLLGMVGPMATKPSVKATLDTGGAPAPIKPPAPAETASSPKPPAAGSDDHPPASGKKPPPPKKAAEAEMANPAPRQQLESQEIEVVDVEVPPSKPAAPPKAPPPVPVRKQQATLLMGSPAAPPKPPSPAKPAATVAEDADKKPASPPAAAKPPSPAKPAATVSEDADKKVAPAPSKVEPAPKPAAPAAPAAAAAPAALLEQAGIKTSTTPSDGGSAGRARGPASVSIEKVGPGSTLGRYEILMPVARGGMASVWAAKLPGTRGFQKIFAIKTMLPDVSDDPEFESMFLDEGRVAARIRHPNVVEIIDLGEQEDVLYLVMEWVEGENLGALVKAARPLGGVPLPIVYRLASQISAGLHAAHELRDEDGNLVDLVHRDVSPANVLISTSGFVKIVDFGIAKSKGRLHVTRVGGVVKGKTPYLSPEQLGQLPIDRRSDLFSFGVLLYVLTTGLHPFRGETDSKTIENIALREPVPLRNIIATVPPEFEAIVLKALAKDAKDRFATAAEMQRAIDQCAASTGAPVTEEDVSAFVRKALGETLSKRAHELRAAVDRAEGRVPSAPDAREVKDETTSDTKPAPAISEEISFTEDASKAPAKSPVGEARARSVAETEPELAPAPSPHPAMPPPPPDPQQDLAAEPAAPAEPAPRPAVSSDLDDASLEVPGLTGRRKPVVQIAIGAVMGLCLIIGGVAIFGGDGKKDPAAQRHGTAAVRTATQDPAAPPTTPPSATQAAAATQEPAPTPAPAASSAAAVDPTPAPAETVAAPAATPVTPTPAAHPVRNPGRNTGSVPTKPPVKPTTKTKKPFNPKEI